MAYDKHTWISGETITATELNDMESGIENNSERLDELTETVNKNTTDIDGKLDKSSVTTSLTSTSDTDALAASAGKTLNDAITNVNTKYSDNARIGLTLNSTYCNTLGLAYALVSKNVCGIHIAFTAKVAIPASTVIATLSPEYWGGVTYTAVNNIAIYTRNGSVLTFEIGANGEIKTGLQIAANDGVAIDTVVMLKVNG